MMRLTCLAVATLTISCVLAQPTPSELQRLKAMEKDLHFDEMFPRRPFTGKMPNIQDWSFDDRYLAFLWNPYDAHGSDLWLYDSRTGKSTQLTSIEKMAKVDADAKKAIEFYKTDDERVKKWDTMSDDEWRKARQAQKERTGPPNPSYSGPSRITWAHHSNEFLMLYRGDIWRWKVGDDMPKRITQTKEVENAVEYLPDDSGFVFNRGENVFKVNFGSEFIRQINPDLPSGFTFAGMSISPKGDQMMVVGQKPGASDRQVDWISYRDRFARAMKTARGVSEDDFNGESALYLYNITDKYLDDIDADHKPQEIYKWSGGEEWQETSLSDSPWSPDGSTFVYSTWKRDQKDLRIWEADLGRKSNRVVYIGTSNGEHQTPGYTRPMYSSDGQNIICMLDKSGWRQVHIMDRVWGRERQVTSGEFESYPLKMSADKKALLVSSSRGELARDNIYRVNLESGEMTRLSSQTGSYGDPTFAHNSDEMAVIFNSWDKLRELYVEKGGTETALTNSHRSDDFWKMIKIKPQLFTYQNRNNQTIHGYMFLPPNFDSSKKHPLFIYVYGGPLGNSKSVTDGDFNSTAYLFNMYLAYTLGYVTVTIDPRGQTGYSAEFGRANFDNIGAAQNEDLVDGVKFLTDKYNIDRTKVGITGWSFGGFQTQYCMYHSPDVFTLGIAGAGPTEWQNYNTWYTGGVAGNSPRGDGTYLDKYSLTRVAENLKSPLLLLHGIEDTNVLFQDTIHVYRKLLQAGKGDLVELALDPTGSHGLGGDIDTRDRHAIYLSFILKHWGFPTP